jgi:hypothetical protein
LALSGVFVSQDFNAVADALVKSSVDVGVDGKRSAIFLEAPTKHRKRCGVALQHGPDVASALTSAPVPSDVV